MKLTRQALLIALAVASFTMSLSAQNLRSEKDPRNTAPTVGTGGSMGGPTGLFTVYDGQTLRKGEFTFSAAYSNYDRDPGNADFNEIPVSFQYGLNDRLEIFFNTDIFRRVRAYSPANLSGFYLPNSRLRVGTSFISPAAMIVAPQGPGTSQYPGWAIFRPAGTQPWGQYPFIGVSTGNFGAPTSPPSALFTGPFFGFAAGSIPTIGTPVPAGSAAMFPGMGSIYGGILPGIVLQTTTLTSANGTFSGTAPTVFTLAPSYLPDAPFLNREDEGVSALSTFTVGGKWRWTNPSKPIGLGVVAYYRWYADTAEGTIGGFNQLQRGASPGGNKGDIGVIFFADARVRKWLNISANVGMHHNASAKMDYANNTYTMLDRPDELIAAIGIDMPINKYIQPIFELRSNQYIGGRTPNAFENSPIDGLAGLRVFPVRNVSLGVAYRHHFNQQDMESFNLNNRTTVAVAGRLPNTINSTFVGVPTGFNTSYNPHGFIVQATVGARNKRQGPVLNQPANVEGINLGTREIVLPCKPDTKPRAGESCPDGTTVSVGTRAADAENDVLTYRYDVNGGRIVGQGANVTWDLSGLRPGTYTITAGVDDGCGFCGKTVTETVVVRDCACEPICKCPSIQVLGGGDVKPGETMMFTADVDTGSSASVSYNWTVSAGTIVEGQGSASIKVSTAGAAGREIVATVNITNPCQQACETRASARGQVGLEPPVAVLKDELRGKITADDVRARVDNFIIALQGENPRTTTAYIINSGSASEVKKREDLIKAHITKMRNTGLQGFEFVRIINNGPIVTRMYIVPEGAEKPRN